MWELERDLYFGIVSVPVSVLVPVPHKFCLIRPLLPAATKLWPRLCFTRVCDSVHRGGLQRTPPQDQADTTPTPSRENPLDQADTPLAGRTPQDQGEPPRPGRHHPHPQQGEPPGPGRHPPGRENPPGPRRTPPDQADPPPDQADPPGRRLQHTVNERPVRILLECILVVSIILIVPNLCRLYCTNVNTNADRHRFTVTLVLLGQGLCSEKYSNSPGIIINLHFSKLTHIGLSACLCTPCANIRNNSKMK